MKNQIFLKYGDNIDKQNRHILTHPIEKLKLTASNTYDTDIGHWLARTNTKHMNL